MSDPFRGVRRAARFIIIHRPFSVLDGDTIEVLHNQHPERIRLSGIDCPEKGQAYGNNAKHTASALAGCGKTLTFSCSVG